MNRRQITLTIFLAFITSTPINSIANGINIPERRENQNTTAKCLSRAKHTDISLRRVTTSQNNNAYITWREINKEELVQVPLSLLVYIYIAEDTPKRDFYHAKLTYTNGTIREGEIKVIDAGQPIAIQGYGEQDDRFAKFLISSCSGIELTTPSIQEIPQRKSKKA